jgi:hypothetical protein
LRQTKGEIVNYNLVEENWIPVLYNNGEWRRVGIREGFEDAGRIRQLAASNPLDNVALLRFLLAVLLWCKDDAKSVFATPSGCTIGIPQDWLTKLDDHKAAFDLLGDGKRFYQDESVKGKEPRPIADLLVEFPGADSVNHMRHVVHDGSYGFCPACCALGILRLSVWAPANRYYPASVNPGSAAYAIVQEKNLLLTLVANLPEAIARADQAPWLSDLPPDSPGAVANLAWRPRKLWLNIASEQGSCANCGGTGVLVVSLCNESGWPTPTTDGRTKKFWDGDPHLLTDGEPISLPALGADASAHSSRFWRDALRLRGTRTGKVVAIGPVVNKFTFQDATSVGVPDASSEPRARLLDSCNRTLRESMKKISPNPKRAHPEISATFVLLRPNTEARIRSALTEPRATEDEISFLHKIYDPIVDQVISSVVCGSPLRRRAMKNAAQALLRNEIENLAHAAHQVPGSPVAEEADPARTRRSRKKKERGT